MSSQRAGLAGGRSSRGRLASRSRADAPWPVFRSQLARSMIRPGSRAVAGSSAAASAFALGERVCSASRASKSGLLSDRAQASARAGAHRVAIAEQGLEARVMIVGAEVAAEGGEQALLVGLGHDAHRPGAARRIRAPRPAARSPAARRRAGHGPRPSPAAHPAKKRITSPGGTGSSDSRRSAERRSAASPGQPRLRDRKLA